MLKRFAGTLLAVVLLAPVSSRAAELPPLVPRDVLFGNPTKQSPSLSPDATRIAYLAPDERGVLNVWVRTVGKTDDAAVTRDPHRGVQFYLWAEDGAHILYGQDSDGDENVHIYSADLRTKVVRDLTPFQGVKAANVLLSPKRRSEMLVGMNVRDPHVFDMYRVDLDSGAISLDTENPGDILSWTTDSDFVIRAATAFRPDTGETVLRVRDAASAPWRDLVRWPFEDAIFFGQINGGSVVAGFAPGGRSLYVSSALHSDTAALVEIDATTGRELRVVASDPKADVAEDPNVGSRPFVMASPRTNELQAVVFEYADWEYRFLDPAVAADFDVLRRDRPGFLFVVSRDDADSRWVVAESRDDGPTTYWLYDRAAKRADQLFVDYPELANYKMAHKQPVVVTARDGLQLVCYLTAPVGVEAKSLPLVLFPHGGPWARDSRYFDPIAQLLANRGYAVLQVNFRGSTGFGKRFFNAGNHEFGLAMQEDLNDAVRWAIGKQIADPKRVAIMGISGGGYAALRGVSTTDLFRCAVDIVGPSDLKLLFSTMPSWWAPVKARWVRRMGDVEHDDELNRRLSPLYHVDRIGVPVLVGQGANDPRVNIKNSDLVVAALRGRNVPVTYVVYSDEGHGFARPENNLDFFGRVEEFLATYLGGRAEPWKKIAGSTADLR
jgi:dipeptidyl aminopeptidase/acylaminoacyl peptidase